MSENTHDQPFGVRCLELLFDRFGIPERRRSGEIMKATGLTFHAANRRVRGPDLIDISVGDLKKLLQRFGMTLAEFFMTVVPDDSTADGRVSSVPAAFSLGDALVPCQLWPGQELRTMPRGVMICWPAAEGWVVGTAQLAPPTARPHAVARVLIDHPTPLARGRIAVLDDNTDITQSVCEALTNAGFVAAPFSTVSELRDSVKRRPFDAYILDWIVRDETVRSLIEDLRAKSPSCVVAVLTGQVQSGRAQPEEIAETMSTYGATYFEKPVTMPILLAWMAQQLKEGPVAA